MSLALFLFKVCVPPVLVAAMSLVARRFGPTIGGLIMGLPWMTGPVLYFLALDKGAEFGARAATGVELGALCIAVYITTYGLTARVMPWFAALPVAGVAFAAAALLTQALVLDLWQATLLGIAGLLTGFIVLPKPRAAPVAPRLPWWDIPARMLVTFALVAMIMLGADRLGPQFSGIVASYPVILTVVGSFTHHQSGYDAILRVLRGISLSLIGFCLFFAVVGYGLPHIGLVPAFLAAAIVGVSFSGGLIVWSRR